MTAYAAACAAIGVSLLSFAMCIYSLRGLASKISDINAEIEEDMDEFKSMEQHMRYIYYHHHYYHYYY